jgi:DNA-binding phage protein
MAELPRYQPTGYLPADVPRLDFANIKESVAMTQGISAALDRLSSFAFKEAAETAQREGAQYGVENAPTMNQLLKAQEAGQTPEQLFAKPGTYFGDAARKIQAQQVRIDFEAKARQNLEAVSSRIDSGSFTLDEIQTEIKAITTKNGSYRKVLASVDADEALKFSASITSAGNAVYKKSIDQFLKLEAIKNENAVTNSLNGFSTSIANILQTDQNSLSVLERVKTEILKFNELVDRSARPEFVKQKRDELQDKIYSNIANHLIDSNPNATQALLKLQNGDVGNLSELYKTLDKDKLGAMFLKTATERASALTAAKNIEKVGNEVKVNDLLIEYHDPKTTSVRKKAIGLEMVKSRVLSIEQIEKFLNPNLENGDTAAFSNIMLQINTGLITDSDELRKTASKAGMNGTQIGKLSERLLVKIDDFEKVAYAKLRRNAGLPDLSVGKNRQNAHQFDKEKVLNEFYEEIKQSEILDRGSFDPRKTSDIAIERYNNTVAKTATKTAAQTKINDVVKNELLGKKKVTDGFSIDADTNLDDLLSKKIINQNQYNHLIGLQTELRKQ